MHTRRWRRPKSRPANDPKRRRDRIASPLSRRLGVIVWVKPNQLPRSGRALTTPFNRPLAKAEGLLSAHLAHCRAS
jgi:hypothetical protein